jgi:hypothetical protein
MKISCKMSYGTLLIGLPVENSEVVVMLLRL